MPPPPWTATQEAEQTRETCLEASLRPTALHLLPQGIQPEPDKQPTAHHSPLRQGGSAQQRTPQGRRVFMQRPGNQQRAHCGFHTRGVLAAHLVEPQQLLHFF